MSASNVEERIVSMQFDNKSFEENAQTSLETLEKLDKSLKFEDAAKGLEDVNSSVKAVDFDTMNSALEAVNNKFSILGTIGDQVLRRIADGLFGITQQALGMANSMTFEQIGAGMEKYGQKTEAVQTIMAATNSTWEAEAKQIGFVGEQMDFVSSQMDRLNWFTDETSYNFIDMVGNVGKFTSNLIPLNESVTAMQGIANWAGISGANVNEASRAMYNLSQAMSIGAVTLMDWKSIENANMATAEFKQTAIDTAVSMGSLVEVGEGLYETLDGDEVSVTNFNKALTESKWFNKDVLQSVLTQYGAFTDVLYGISEQTDLTATDLLAYTDSFMEGGKTANETVNEMAEETGLSVKQCTEYLKELSKEEYDLGRRSFKAAQEAKTFAEAIDATKDAVSTGWMNIFEKIFGNYEQAKGLWTGVANELWDIFAGPVDYLNSVMDVWSEMEGREDLINGLADAYKVLKETIMAVVNAFHDIFFGVFETADDEYDTMGEKLANLTSRFASFMSTLRNSEGFKRFIEGLSGIFRGLFSILKAGITVVTSIIGAFGPLVKLVGLIGSYFVAAVGGIADFVAGMVMALHELGAFSIVGNVLHTIFNAIYTGVVAIIDFVEGMVDAIKESEQFQSVMSSVGSVISSVIDEIGYFVKRVQIVFDHLGKLEGVQKLLGVFNQIKEAIGSFGSNALNSFLGLFGGETKEASFNFKLPNLQDIYSFVDGVAGKLAEFAGWVDTTSQAVSDFFESVKNGTNNDTGALGVLADVLSVFFSVIDKIKSSAPDKLKQIGSSLKEFGESVKENGFFATISTIPASFGKKLQEIGAALSAFFDEVKKFADKIGLTESLSIMFDNLKKMFTNFSLGNVAKNAALIAVILIVIRVIQALRKVSHMVDDVVGIPKKFGKLIDELSNTLKAVQFNLRADALLKIAKAIAIFAGSITLLSLIDNKRLTTVVGDMMALILVLTLMLHVIGKMKSGGSAPKIFESISEALGGFLEGIKNAFERIGKIIGVGTMILAIAAAIAILVSTIAKISQIMSGGDWYTGLLGVIELMGLLVVVVAALAGINKLIGGIDTKLAGSLLVMTICIAALAKVVESLSTIEDLETAGWGLIAVIAAVIGAATALGVLQKIVGKISLSVLVGLGVVTAIISILGELLVSIGMLPVEQAQQGIAGIITLSVALMIMAASLVVAGHGSLEGAASLLILTGAIWVLTQALQECANIKWESIQEGFTIVAVCFGVLVGLVAIAAAFSGALLTLGVAVESAGIGLLAGGVGMLAFAAAVALLSKYLAPLATALVQFGTTIIQNGAVIAEAFMTILQAVAIAIIISISPIVAAITILVLAVCQGIINASPGILQTLNQIFAVVIQWLYEATLLLGNALFGMLISLLTGLAQSIHDNGPLLWSAIGDVLSQIVYIILDGLMALAETIFGWFPGVKETVRKEGEEMRQALAEQFAPGEMTELTSQWANGGTAGIEQAGPQMASTAERVAQDTRASLRGGFDDMETIGNEATTGVANGIESGTPDVLNAIGGLTGQANGSFDLGFMGEGTNTEIGNVVGAFMGADGANAAESFSGSIVDSYDPSAILGKTEFTIDDVQGYLDGVPMGDKGEQLGTNLNEGFENGITSTSNKPIDAASDTADDTANAMAKTLQEKSPSRRGMEIGGYLTEGFAKGIEDESGTAEKAAEAVADKSATSAEKTGRTGMEKAGTSAAKSFASAMSKEGSVSSPKSGVSIAEQTAKGIDSKKQTIIKAANTVAKNYSTALESPANKKLANIAGAAVAADGAKGADSKKTNFTKAGNDAGSSFANGVGTNANKSSAYAKGASVAANAQSGIGSKSAYSAGESFSQGFIDGMDSKLYSVKLKAIAIAETALTALKERIKQGSPSKLTMQSGRFFTQGFVIGITQLSHEAEKASESVGKEALNGMNAAVAKTAGIMDGMEYNPTITPVMDLSQIQNGVDQMNQMLYSQRTIGLSAIPGATRVSQDQILAQKIDSAFQNAANNIINELRSRDMKGVTQIEVPLYLDGRQVAKATAKYTQAEINRIEQINLRKVGIVST